MSKYYETIYQRIRDRTMYVIPTQVFLPELAGFIAGNGLSQKDRLEAILKASKLYQSSSSCKTARVKGFKRYTQIATLARPNLDTIQFRTKEELTTWLRTQTALLTPLFATNEILKSLLSATNQKTVLALFEASLLTQALSFQHVSRAAWRNGTDFTLSAGMRARTKRNKNGLVSAELYEQDESLDWVSCEVAATPSSFLHYVERVDYRLKRMGGKKKQDVTFLLPPTHHSALTPEPDEFGACGFCWFNLPMISAQHYRAKGRAVFVFDSDVNAQRLDAAAQTQWYESRGIVMTSVAGNGVYPFPNKRYAKSSAEYQAAFGTDSDYVRRFDASLYAKTKAGRDTERSQQRQLIEDHVINTLKGMPEHSVFIWQDGLDSLTGNTFSTTLSPVGVWSIREAIAFDRKIKQTCKEKGIFIYSTQEGGYVRKNFAAAAGKYGPSSFPTASMNIGPSPRTITISLANGLPVKAVQVRAAPAKARHRPMLIADGSKRKGCEGSVSAAAGGGGGASASPATATVAATLQPTAKQATQSKAYATELFLDQDEQGSRLRIFFTHRDADEIDSLISNAQKPSPLPLFREQVALALKYRTLLLDFAVFFADTVNISDTLPIITDAEYFDENASNALLHELGAWALNESYAKGSWLAANPTADSSLRSLVQQAQEIYMNVSELTFWIGVMAGNDEEVRLLFRETNPEKFIHQFRPIKELKEICQQEIRTLEDKVDKEEEELEEVRKKAKQAPQGQPSAGSVLRARGESIFRPADRALAEKLLQLRHLPTR